MEDSPTVKIQQLLGQVLLPPHDELMSFLSDAQTKQTDSGNAP
jgi:hypothetical protein